MYWCSPRCSIGRLITSVVISSVEELPWDEVVITSATAAVAEEWLPPLSAARIIISESIAVAASSTAIASAAAAAAAAAAADFELVETFGAREVGRFEVVEKEEERVVVVDDDPLGRPRLPLAAGEEEAAAEALDFRDVDGVEAVAIAAEARLLLKKPTITMIKKD